jgi:hypothetical protein
MQYIITKYLKPTNQQGSRIKALTSFEKEAITIPYDYSLDIEQAHAKAAMQLAMKLGWNGEYAAGGNEIGYVFTYLGSSNLYSTDNFEAE